ncbi:hypothetical protein KZ570_003162 [Escherichia coli]|nr:hypothetical protein [Escherichia coli]
MDKVMEFLDSVGSELSSKQLKVGFLEGATYPDGTSLPMVAASNEFGNPASGSPPRPFFRNAISENSDKWAENAEMLMKSYNGNTDMVLDLMGAIIRDDIMRAIDNLSSPALSPVTILLRSRFPMRRGMTFTDVLKAREDVKNGITGSGHDNPLIWTGDMQKSVSYEVSEIESSTDSQ